LLTRPQSSRTRSRPRPEKARPRPRPRPRLNITGYSHIIITRVCGVVMLLSLLSAVPVCLYVM